MTLRSFLTEAMHSRWVVKEREPAGSNPRGGRRSGVKLWVGSLEQLETRMVPAVITVSSLADAGDGTLRAAILQANSNPDADTISFAPGVNGTISLNSSLPAITTDLFLNGPGASSLTVSGVVDSNPLFRVFEVGSEANVTLAGLTIEAGRAEDRGGGILNQGSLTLVQSTLTNCLTSGQGGGVYNSGTMAIHTSTISKNRAASFDGGGGIFNVGILAITNSTISGNDAGTMGTSRGGGVHNRGALAITNSTISGNRVLGSGGGIFNAGPLWLISSTVTDNTSWNYRASGGMGGGIFNQGGGQGPGVLALNSSIVSGNFSTVSGQDISGVGYSVGHNLLFDAPDVHVNVTDLANTLPNLGPLSDNGGPTFTHALLPGSGAIDASIMLDGITTDQRGVTRPQGSAPDIGAFEAVGVPGAQPPSVVRAQRIGGRARPTQLLLTFSEDMAVTTVQSIHNYKIILTGPGGRPLPNRPPIPLRSVVYDADAKTVAITPGRGMPPSNTYQLTAIAERPTGLHSTLGAFLAGSRSGQPGTDFVALIKRGRVVTIS